MHLRLIAHGLWILLLTLLTQLGGIAWLLALAFRRRWLVFLPIYAALSLSAAWIAPALGRVPLPCWGDGLRMQSFVYCALNRHYVAPEIADVVREAAAAVRRRHPGTETLVLDANFPFLDGFPLLPHLSHADGRKIDLAFYYQDGSGTYLPGKTKSPIGYFAFEPGPTDCPPSWPTLRWDLDWLQGLWPERRPDAARLHTLVQSLTKDPRVGKIFLEPHLVVSWGLEHPKIRFQGCRAARHDDHIHIQL